MMKRNVMVTALAMSAFAVFADAQTVSLNGAWKLETFAQPDDGAVRTLPIPNGLEIKSYQATVPGCCEMELVKAGEMPDPMFSTNALEFTALEGNQWLYTKTFTGRDWTDATNYDISLDVRQFGVNGAVDFLMKCIE